jgi:hypothetical protein
MIQVSTDYTSSGQNTKNFNPLPPKGGVQVKKLRKINLQEREEIFKDYYERFKTRKQSTVDSISPADRLI